MEELIKKYKDYKKEIGILSYICFILSFDEATDCPLKDKQRSLEVSNIYQKKIMDIVLSDEYISLIEHLNKNKDRLDSITKLDMEIEYKEIEKNKKIPKDELYKHYDNVDKCNYYWHQGKLTLDFSKFEEEQVKLVNYYKKLTKWLETDSIKGFDVILNEMEEGYNQEKYDKFFDCIEKELVPFIKDILNKPKKYNPKLDTLKFDIPRQKEITKVIANSLGYTNEVGCIRETEHPFTNWANSNDVRVTTKYKEELLFSNIYSIIHEIGHATYQLQMDPIYNDTNIFNYISCASHESQSRFYENYLGRRKSFVNYLYKVVKKYYPKELEDITSLDLYYYINSVSNQPIRVEADELTYPIHILVRYKIEKALFNNQIEVKDIDPMFNKLMKDYLGIEIANKNDGCYQDVHWSSDFGYFPTYALGSAYGAMFLEAMEKDIDIDKDLENGNFKNINKWLKDHIHHYSGTLSNLDLVKKVTNQEFDSYKYVNYLKNKFSEIYK